MMHQLRVSEIMNHDDSEWVKDEIIVECHLNCLLNIWKRIDHDISYLMMVMISILYLDETSVTFILMFKRHVFAY